MRKKRSSEFPNLSPGGQYDSFGHFIALPDTTYADLESAKLSAASGELSNKAIELLSTFSHEMRHWADHVATLRGAQSLLAQHEAIRAWESRNESEFYFIKAYVDSLFRAEYDIYYQENYKAFELGDLSNRWMYSYTAGQRFDGHGRIDPTKPVLFIRFNEQNGTPILRCPVSLTSFWELCAVAEEIRFKASCRFFDDRKSAEFLRQAYAPDYSLYASSAHIYSNLSGNPEVLSVYLSAAKIISFLLNLPDEYSWRLPIQVQCGIWGQKNDYFLFEKDLGYLYYQFCALFKRKTELVTKNDIDEILDGMGLPITEKMEILAKKEMEKCIDKLKKSSYKTYFQSLMEKGYKIFEQRGILGDRVPALQYVERPTIFLQSGQTLQPFQKEWIPESDGIFDKLVAFASICGI